MLCASLLHRLGGFPTQVIAEKSADAPGDWATVKLTVGVTRDKLRTLVIQFYADSRVSALLSPLYSIGLFAPSYPSFLYILTAYIFHGLLFGTKFRQAPMLSFARFSGRAGDGLYTAIRDALVERRIPLSFLATDAEDVSLDPHYVRCVLPARVVAVWCRVRYGDDTADSFPDHVTPCMFIS